MLWQNSRYYNPLQKFPIEIFLIEPSFKMFVGVYVLDVNVKIIILQQYFTEKIKQKVIKLYRRTYTPYIHKIYFRSYQIYTSLQASIWMYRKPNDPVYHQPLYKYISRNPRSTNFSKHSKPLWTISLCDLILLFYYNIHIYLSNVDINYI